MASGISTVTKPPEEKNESQVLRGTGQHTSFDNFNQYFYEDEVFKVDRKGRVKFGVITENSEATFYSDEDTDDEVLSKGEIRVKWHPDGKEEVLMEHAVGLADRTLMPGDVVRRLVAGKDTQRGYCREINMNADVKIMGTKFVVQAVNAERLKPVNMPNDNAVCLDSWVGSTKEVEEVVTLRSSCGAVFEVPDFCLIDLKDIHSKSHSEMIPNGRCFYPGQILVGKLGGNLDQIKYVEEEVALKRNKKGVPISRRFFVNKVEVVAVHIHWQCKALSEEDAAEIKTNVLQQPDAVVRGDNLKRLKRLNLFEACTLQINDKNFLNISDCDTIVKKAVWEIDQAFRYKPLNKQQLLDSGSKKPSKTVKLSSTTLQYDKLKNKLSNTNLDVVDHNKLNPKSNKLTKLTKANLEKFNNPPLNVAVPVPMLPLKGDAVSIDKKEPVSTPKDDWQTEDELEGFEEEDEDDVDEDSFGACGSSTATTVSTCSTPTPKSSPKRIRLQKKNVKKMKKSGVICCNDKPPPATGEKVVTEALVVYSSATVVWQDGTVEKDIPSTELYPIHHLDDHEFFPGDFVLSGKEEVDVTYRDYGVIQNVDHQGRTANVKWFTTYTAIDNPQPIYKGDTEESVYDLKDHPDFQYRPGTIVIRVANFVGEDANCTAGQIIDNYKNGQVKVWWVDGHISMSWPQDLFEVAHIDDTQEFWGGNNESDDSWETESETSAPGEIEVEEKPMKKISELISNLERARIGFTRLEEILCMNPHLQSRSVMRKLLQVYKVCRFIDKLINCTFFHEDNFMGLLERVRKGSNQTERAQDQRNRLFNESPNTKVVAQSPKATDYTPKVLFNVSSTPFKKRSNANPTNTNHSTVPLLTTTEAAEITAIVIPSMTTPQNTITAVSFEQDCTSPSVKDSESSLIVRESSPLCPCNQEKNRLLSSVMMNMEKVVEKSSLLKLNSSSNSNSQDDSGHCSRNDIYDGSSASYASSNDLATTATAASNPNDILLKTADDQKSISCSSIELAEESPDFICARLCSLLQVQLNKCLAEIQKKYCKDSFNLSEVIEFDGEEEDEKESVWEENDTNSTTPAVESCGKPKLQSDSCDTITTISEISPIQSLEAFQVLNNAPSTHKFHLAIFHTTNSQQYYKAIQREHRMLKNGLPSGVWVRAFEDRMDLMSVMIEGPKNTPYEDGLFFFDIQLGKDFPKNPPLCHYISYCSDRLNPNLYEDGKVCVSLLGTWSGRDTEVWGPNSTLLQVIVSIQGLILVSEPYFNEAGYEKQKGTQHGLENSRMYNEMVIIKLVQAMTKLVSSPPEIFRGKILTHFSDCGEKMYKRIKLYMELSKVVTPSAESKSYLGSEEDVRQVKNNTSKPPEFPLVPASRGFCLTLAGLLENFLAKIKLIDLKETTVATAKTPKTECDSEI